MKAGTFEGFEAFHYLARAIVQGAGAPPKEERRVLLSAARSWGLRPAAAAAILTAAADPDAEGLPPPEDPERRSEVLYQAATVAMADGRLALDERRYLSRLAKGLGFGAEEVREALGRAKRERSYNAPGEPPREGSEGERPLELVPLPDEPLPGDLGERELELAKARPTSLLTYVCRSSSGSKTTVHLFVPSKGFEVETPAGARTYAYEDVQAVALGLTPDEDCVCSIHPQRGAAIRLSNVSATYGDTDYEYLAFVRKFHKLLREARVRPHFRVVRSGGRRGLWIRAALVTIPTLVILFGMIRWTMSFGEPELPACATFLVGVIGVVASGVLLKQAIGSDGAEYEPPKFPASVLPGADDVTVLEALGKGGVAALWVIATVMSSDDD